MRTFILTTLVLVWAFFPALSADLPWGTHNWKTDFTLHSIPYSEVTSVIGKDQIPAINSPKFAAIAEVDDIPGREPVIGLEINGDARAYPLRVMTRHEIVNDVVGGKPVAVTYCPLCNASIVFDAMIDGARHDFGTTGKLRNSDLVMYDRQTESWWQQFTGNAIMGEYTGRQLKIVPSRLESWDQFRERFPNGKVLYPRNFLRRYGSNPYVGYDTSDRPFLFFGELPNDMPAMTRVIVIRRDGREPMIIPMQRVVETGRLEIDGYDISWREGQASALDTSNISKGREVGTIIVTRDSANGAKDIAYDLTFAFVAKAFHPDTAFLMN